MFSIYIHIPFCLSKCGYCDFHSVEMSPEDIPQKEYVAVVCAEAEELADKYNLRGREVGSIYFGGGTPTMFETRNLEHILNAIRDRFSVAPDAEITIEANPETLRLKHLSTYALTHFFNRLSIGIQSFNDAHLQNLGRIHSAETARHAVKSAQDAGFKNISIDIMWGLPGQTVAELEDDLNEAIALNVQHISAYQLTLEKNVLACRRAGVQASKKMPNEDLAREMWLLVHNKLTSAGYEHYEISNFSRVIVPVRRSFGGRNTSDEAISCTQFRCQHNLNYWNYGEWLGLGSGASSFLACHCEESAEGGRRGNPLHSLDCFGLRPRNDNALVRFTSSKDIPNYLLHKFTYETETVSAKTAMAEYCFMGLRTSDGIDLADFKRRFNVEFDEVYPGLCEKWSSLGLTYALTHLHTYALNQKGWLISDELFQSLV